MNVAESIRSRIAFVLILPALVSCASGGRDTKVLEEKVRSILELPTYEQVYRDIVFVERDRSFLMIRTMHTQVLFSIDIRVQAGIDLSEGLSISRGPGRSAVTVRLPAAKILLIDADESSIHQYFVKESGGRIERLDYYDEIDRIKDRIREDAIQREILQKAASNAKSMIAGLLAATGFEEVRFAPL